MIKYMKEVHTKEEATHEYKEGTAFLKPINQKKIIDLSCLVGNEQILLEFSDDLDDCFYIDFLEGIENTSKYHFRTKKLGSSYKYARILMGQTYYWGGGDKCPLPEGIEYEFITRDGYTFDGLHANQWRHDDRNYGIIAITPTGIKDGWKYEWEKDDES